MFPYRSWWYQNRAIIVQIDQMGRNHKSNPIVIIHVSVVCSVLVSAASIKTKSFQVQNNLSIHLSYLHQGHGGHQFLLGLNERRGTPWILNNLPVIHENIPNSGLGQVCPHTYSHSFIAITGRSMDGSFSRTHCR